MNSNRYVEILFNVNCNNCNHIQSYNDSKYWGQKIGSNNNLVAYRIHNVELHKTFGYFLLSEGKIFDGPFEITIEDFIDKTKEGTLVRINDNIQTTKEFINKITNTLSNHSYRLKKIDTIMYCSHYLIEKTAVY